MSAPSANSGQLSAPSVALPKGGGAIRAIGEKFTTDPVSGTGRMSVPLPLSPARELTPSLALTYDSGSGNGPFGLGWQLALPAVSRRTETGLPRYRDAEDSDTFALSSADDLVPVPAAAGGEREIAGHLVRRYRPRTDSDTARIERWTRGVDGDVHWRVLSADNVLSVYGRDDASRIADPADPRRVFSWLLCETRDDRGNAVQYRYRQEDSDGVDLTAPHEHGRGGADAPSRRAARYLKSVRYGNQVPLLDQQGRRPVDVSPVALRDAGWMFELVLDYGDHEPGTPTPEPTRPWLCRADPFSTHRAAFEVRTYRLCQRVLMFHHFPEEPGVGRDCLVASTTLGYRDTSDTQGVPGDARLGHPVVSLLATVASTGHRRRTDGPGYTTRSLPPLSFSYATPTISSEVRRLDAGSRENLPAGLHDTLHTWVDLDGEGLSGVLSSHGGAWYYKPSLGGGRLGPLRRLSRQPAARVGAAAPLFQLTDLDGDGRIDLVRLGAEPQGFYERTADAEGWDTFTPFASVPHTDLAGTGSRLLDLTGDGLADLLTCQDTEVVWYPALGAQGFGAPQGGPHPDEEGRGARPLLGDRTQTLFLADMTGDGLTDLVRVRNGEVRYWPNQGYGRFGAPVVMSGAPHFDTPDAFDPQRLRLADLDGSGTVDLLYIAPDGVRLWFNQSGNGFGPANQLPDLPHLGHPAQVSTADLLGNGTACLVWSSPLPADADDPLRYIDLMGGTKPHLLTGCVNNMGAETRISYASSTAFHLADRRAGRPWLTRLPFPVHVVERVEHRDRVRRTRFTTRYAYHHGHYDGVEREFCGFGMVEQHDSEAYEGYSAAVAQEGGAQETAAELFQPPVTIRTWFHTGAHPDRRAAAGLLERLTGEFYLGERHLPGPELPAGLDAGELRDCARALKGLPIRSEVYSFDGSPDQEHPYTVSENTYTVDLLQAREGTRRPVFLVTARESMTRQYDRDPSDPRTEHTLVLERGPHGRVLRSAAVVHGRQVADPTLPAEVTRDQRRSYITCAESDYTPDLDTVTPVPAHRIGQVCESRGYEITGLAPGGAAFTIEELRAGVDRAGAIGYEAEADPGAVRKRLLAQSRTLFRDNALAPLALGRWDSLGIPYESYRLALTPAVVAAHYAGELTDADFTAAGYVHLDGDDNWWIPSGTDVHPPGDPAARFYRPVGVRDPFGIETVADHDRYDLLPERVRTVQAPWDTTTVRNDYRVLGPWELTDPNGNRSATEFDELGAVVATALLGKEGAGEGDTLADPTTRLEYELFNWTQHGTPNRTRILAKEQHGPGGRLRESYAHLDGGGAVALTKSRTAPGEATVVLPDGSPGTVHADPRWIGSGRTVVNNKGLPVKSYEPYFSLTSAYDPEEAMATIGSTAIHTYDPLGRAIRTDLPDGTFTRTEYGQWSSLLHDPNDTVRESGWYERHGRPDPATEPEPLNDPERRAAWLAAQHAGTPSATHLDSLGRPVLSVSSYGGGVTVAVRSETDLTGRHSRLYDQLGREVAYGFTGMAGQPVLASSAERGRRWTFTDVSGALVKMWDEHGRAFRAAYDELRRPVSGFVRPPGGTERAFQHVVHGDRHPEAASRNLLGAPHQVFDGDGCVRVLRADFKGNPVEVERLFTRDHTAPPDWTAVAQTHSYAAVQAVAAPLLYTTEPFTAASAHDALGRTVRLTLPDGTQIVPLYDESGRAASASARIGGQGTPVTYLAEQAYDALGRRQSARFGNGLDMRYGYDPDTLRLIRLTTGATGAPLQDLRFTHDPVGNITEVRDGAQQTHFFANQVVEPVTRYTYDALYQLVRATGREHAGGANDTVRDSGDLAAVGQLPHPNDAGAVRTYTELYEYDLLGNLKRLRHRAATDLWTRHYRYAHEDDPADLTNRLRATSRPGDPEFGPYTATYDHDSWGNITRLASSTPGELAWDVFDRLTRAELGGGGRAYYRYGADGQRTRKVIERPGGETIERLYLGPLEIQRRSLGGTLHFERHTLHLSDDTGRVAQADVKLRDDRGIDPANPLGVPLLRYQYGNHLGSATLETDEAGRVLSYEEYHPYGTTAYRSGRADADLSLKRYRFAGKERDEETGLYYVGARYYVPWLGRWASPDPAGFVSGLNLYAYCSNAPSTRVDADGMDDHSCMLALGQGGFIPMDLEPGGCFAAVREGRIDPSILAPGSLPRPPARAPGGGSSGSGGAGSGPGRGRAASTGRRARRSRAAGGGPAPAPPPADVGGGTEPSASPVPTPQPATAPPPPPPAAGEPEPAIGVTGSAAAQAAPAAERFIWDYEFPGTGVRGTQRGRILEWMLGVPWRDNTAGIDRITDSAVQQIKSVDSGGKMGNIARSATRDAAAHIAANPGTAGTRRPQAVIVTRTDVSAAEAAEIATATQPARGRRIPANALPPEHVRGLPGNWGRAGTGLSVLGTGLSAYSLYQDWERGDWAMGAGDALSTAGGGLELYALGSSGATVAGVSAMSAGLVLGGVGIAVASGVSGVRAYRAGDTAGAIAGAVGVAAGLAIAAGVIFGAPLVLAAGAIAAVAVGLFHLARWLF